MLLLLARPIHGPTHGPTYSRSRSWPVAWRADGDIPEYFLCPITGCIMRQPAMTPEGVTYDYDALTEWLSSKQTDPSTNLPLSAEQLCPNRTVRSMIEDFIAKGPNFLFAGNGSGGGGGSGSGSGSSSSTQ